jgi:hypothetical protein
MVDSDGKTAYSKTVVLKESGGSLLLTTVRPNPFTSEVTVVLSLNEARPLTVGLVDIAGRRVVTRQVVGVPGVNNISLSGLSNLPQGLYLVRVSGEGLLLQEKIVK